jgi:hypothetical protein
MVGITGGGQQGRHLPGTVGPVDLGQHPLTGGGVVGEHDVGRELCLEPRYDPASDPNTVPVKVAVRLSIGVIWVNFNSAVEICSPRRHLIVLGAAERG